MTNRTDHIGRGCLPLLPMKRVAWCEANGVDFLFGLAKRADQTRRTWSRRRRIVAKAE